MVRKTITIVGVGALGSHLTTFSRNWDVDVKVIDFDRVEQKNVASQFYGKPSVGKLKVEALAQLCQYLYGIKLTTVAHRLTTQNVKELLGRSDLVIDCLDNGKSREVVQTFVRSQGIACLHGAVAADGAFGRVIWDDQFQIDHESAPGAVTCEDGRFAPFIMEVVACMAQAVQEFLSDGKRLGFSISPSRVIAV